MGSSLTGRLTQAKTQKVDGRSWRWRLIISKRNFYAAIFEKLRLSCEHRLIVSRLAPGKVLFWACRRFWAGTKTLAMSFQYIANPSLMPGASPSLLLDGDEPAEPDGLRAGRTKLPPWRER